MTIFRSKLDNKFYIKSSVLGLYCQCCHDEIQMAEYCFFKGKVSPWKNINRAYKNKGFSIEAII